MRLAGTLTPHRNVTGGLPQAATFAASGGSSDRRARFWTALGNERITSAQTVWTLGDVGDGSGTETGPAHALSAAAKPARVAHTVHFTIEG